MQLVKFSEAEHAYVFGLAMPQLQCKGSSAHQGEMPQLVNGHQVVQKLGADCSCF